LVHNGAPFGKCDPNNHKPTAKWAPFYIACKRLVS
jgi:hypothetical protein